MVVDIIDGEILGYMTTKDVANFLGVEPSTIRVWIKRGKVEPLTIISDGHRLNFISRQWALEKFEEMYPEIVARARKGNNRRLYDLMDKMRKEIKK